MFKRIVSFTVDGFMAGLLLSICCAVNLSAGNSFAGAFLFSLGLFAIMELHLGLYTGKVGYLVVKRPKYAGEVTITLLSNTIGAFLGGWLISITRFGGILRAKSIPLMDAKMSDTPISMFLLSMFCGILIFIAVEGDKKCTQADDHVGALFTTLIPVMIFIICGFNHCIADMGYFALSGFKSMDKAPLYFAMAILGNAAGCMVIPVMKKFSINKWF
ncbi:MAG: formate/nitrite transporter family protein [Clostridia bacterium]|nr:formate/nitrite transporter family protein [Clostridia bacterium]